MSQAPPPPAPEPDTVQPDTVEARLRAILSGSGAAAAWEWQVAARRIVGDPAFAALYGIAATEAASGISPALFFSIIHPSDRDRIRLAMGGMLRGAEILSKEYRIVAADGVIRWVHARGRSHYDKQDTPIRCDGVLVDITVQKRLEERLRIAQSAGGVGTFEHVDGFGTVFVSAQFCNLLGLHVASDLPVRTINALVHPDDPPIIDVAAHGTPGQVSQMEFRVSRADTSMTRWLMRRGEYLRDSETVGVRFSGVIYDITEAKCTEARLRTLNDTLESRVHERTRERDRIWRVSQDLLGVADAAGHWVSINPAWEAVLGWAEADIVGTSWSWLEHPEDTRSLRDTLTGLEDGARVRAVEHRLRQRQGGWRWLSWSAVREAGLCYCVARDVTAEKDAAAALVHAEEQLRQSQKMEAVGQLTGGLAHDFNNLLGGIVGSLEMMQVRLAQGRSKDLDRYISAAQSACRRAAALTHRLLAFSRRQTLAPRPTDVHRLITGMEDLVRGTMGPGVTVEITAERDLWNTLVDPNQLENALLNLCINARDAMPLGGRLWIELANRWLDEPTARERDLMPGPYVSLLVRDTGTGMSREVMARAFDPFFTTKPIGQGTGLGLSMIYGFARQSGGDAHLLSEPGHGTCVRLFLPRYLGGVEQAATEVLPRGVPGAGGGVTVLVVDDEPTLRMLIGEVLEDLGYAIVEAADGAGGLLVLQSSARVDLLVTDVGLPGGMNGRQLADAGRELRPELKVLFITGYAEASLLHHGTLAAGMHVMIKPFAMEELARRIGTVIAETAEK